MMKMERMKMERMKVERVKMEGMKMEGIEMKGMKMERMKMERMKLERMKLERMKLERMKMERMKMERMGRKERMRRRGKDVKEEKDGGKGGMNEGLEVLTSDTRQNLSHSTVRCPMSANCRTILQIGISSWVRNLVATKL